MLAGIGISHSDVPSLLAKLLPSQIADKERVFDVLSGCRQIDLSVATYSQFAFNKAYFSYPKAKSALYQKYLSGKRHDTGKNVWEMYESQNYSDIESRCAEEIDDALAIYKAMIDRKKETDRSLARLKKLEKIGGAIPVVQDEI